MAEAHGSAAVLAFASPQERPAGTVKAGLMARTRAKRESVARYAWPLDETRIEVWGHRGKSPREGALLGAI